MRYNAHMTPVLQQPHALVTVITASWDLKLQGGRLCAQLWSILRAGCQTGEWISSVEIKPGS